MASILIVDDSSTVAVMLQRYLTRAGHEVAVAPDGTAGLARAQELLPDLVVLDRLLPGMDGYAVCRSLKAVAASHSIKVLMLTGTTDDTIIRAAFEAGVDQLLAKSAGLPSIGAAVHDLLHQPEVVPTS